MTERTVTGDIAPTFENLRLARIAADDLKELGVELTVIEVLKLAEYFQEWDDDE